MGHNKRYAKHYARLMDDRIEEFIMREELIMLTAAELDVENYPPTDFPEPRRVYAWIRYPSKAIRIQAHAIAYTRTAVKIRFLEPLIKIHREGWVWLSAVTPIPTHDNDDSDDAKRA
ncbi:hypothetical protein ACX80N_17135 [Arthrobacter sp. MDT2-16]